MGFSVNSIKQSTGGKLSQSLKTLKNKVAKAPKAVADGFKRRYTSATEQGSQLNKTKVIRDSAIAVVTAFALLMGKRKIQGNRIKELDLWTEAMD